MDDYRTLCHEYKRHAAQQSLLINTCTAENKELMEQRDSFKRISEERKILIDELWAEKGELLKEIGRLEQTLWNWRNYGSE